MKQSAGDKPVGPTRDQHFLPQLYLRGFSEQPAGTHIWVYTPGRPFAPGKKSHKNPFRQAIKSTGAERDHYAFRTLEGKVEYDHYDKILTKQEETVKEAFIRVRDRCPIMPDDKKSFAAYIDLMVHRVPARDRRVTPLVKQNLERFIPFDRLARLAANEGRFSEALRFTRDREETKKVLERELQLTSMVVRGPGVMKHLTTMTWNLFCVDDGRFFPTTDDPVVLPLNLGLAHPNAYVLFPVSSQLVLFALNVKEPDQLYVQPTPDQYQIFRTTILANASERAYAHCADQGIADLLQGIEEKPPSSAHDQRKRDAKI